MFPDRPGLRAFALAFLAPLVSSQQAVSRVVDDSYVFDLTRLDGIQYSPQWYPEQYDSNRQQGTLHTSLRSSSNLVYFFQGSAIYYYADRDVPHGLARISLDSDEQGVMVPSNASSLQYQQLLWKATNLGPGDHQLVISHAGTDGQYVGLDYLLGASVVPAEAVFVDDDDARLIYSSGWDPVLPSQLWATYFNNTMHRTNSPGASVTLRFNGTAAWYFTDLQPVHGKVNITVDGGKSWIIYGNTGQQMQQRMLWNVTDLPYGEHTVVVTHQDTNITYATLDFFRTPTPPPKFSAPIGAIVGAVVGGVVLFLSAGLLYFWLRRRRGDKIQTGASYFGTGSPTSPPLLNHPHNPPRGYVSQPFGAHEATSSSTMTNQVLTSRTTEKVRLAASSNNPPTVAAPPTLMLSSEWTQTGSDSGITDRNLDAPPAYT
ncbi:hypothetical protein FRC10_008546 [Ceratobasidium sp. 414]|nr:hypothetical protein FRC10_008546 [Ceratobasidium sp. 414]